MVMAHGLLFTSLFCLQRSIADPRWGWAIAAALFCAALVQTKVFVFVQLFAAVGIAVAINLAVFRRWVFLKEWLAIALISAPLVFYTIQANTLGAQISWTWSSGIESYVQNAFRAASWPLLVTYPIAGLIVYLALTFGFRIVGIGELIKSFRLSRIHSTHLLLAVFVILGPILTLTTRLVPYDVHDGYNNAIWFMVGSKYVATVFAVMALAKWWDRFGWTARALMTAVMAVVTSASTIQYLARSSSANLDEMTPLLRESAAFLDREARPGEVVVTRHNEAVLALTKLHIPVYITFSDYLSSRDIVLARAQDVEDFWRSWRTGTVREDLLTRYEVNWIVASQNETPTALGALPAMVLGKLEIKQEFTNGEFMIFRVRAIHGKSEL
jgi:hypothetical protein